MPSRIISSGDRVIARVRTLPQLRLGKDSELVSDSGLPIGDYELQLVSPFADGDRCMGYAKLLRRAREKKASTSMRLGRLMISGQERLPKNWRFYQIAFPGTVLQHPDPRRRTEIPYLYYGGDLGWQQGLMPSSNYFTLNTLLVQLHKIKKA